jgi:YesN/AraC family two-component response regulator
MKLKCLIVEDALFLREVYRYSLKNENIEIVDEASDGMEALIKINQHKPDLIILDLVLPMKNGFDVLKEASHLSPRSKCIVISSFDDHETISKALALGAIKYLTKPFTKSQLIEAIAEVGQIYNEVYNG